MRREGIKDVFGFDRQNRQKTPRTRLRELGVENRGAASLRVLEVLGR
jgi:hypothetical protein